MMPFGETILAWRLERGMTQAALARAARVPRPNLSAIERGDRDVTLRTLRALALALDVLPGVLANGTPPRDLVPLTREGMERIVRAANRDSATDGPREAAIARQLRAVTNVRRAGKLARRPRSADHAYFRLRSQLAGETLASLVDRVAVDLERA